MIFSTLDFGFFFAVVFLIWWIMPAKLRLHAILPISLVFYGWYVPVSVLQLLAVTLLCWFPILQFQRTAQAIWIRIGVIAVVVHLFIFKYLNSLLAGLASALDWQSLSVLRTDLGIVQPLAISFYSFQIISVLMDASRGKTGPLTFYSYVRYVIFFPRLIAGPIERYQNFVQSESGVSADPERMRSSVALFLSGLFKKVVIADPLATIASPFWSAPESYHAISSWFAVAAFSVQIYADFSGYTDMARGVGKALGYDLPENFRAPYFANSFRDIWRRWHISLSTWIRDYIFIPLGGSRVSSGRADLNLLIAMSLSGLWHGETYPFLIWGFVLGVFLIVERRLGVPDNPGPGLRLILHPWVILGWMLAFVFFRAPDLDTAISAFRSLFNSDGQNLNEMLPGLALFLPALVFHFWQEWQDRLELKLRRWYPALIPLWAIIVYVAVIRARGGGVRFIYFQF